VTTPAPTFEIIATAAFGLEAVVAREVEQLGYVPRIESTGRIAFTGDALAVARANLWLRAADRVLIRVGRFVASNFDELFEGVKALPWGRWIARDAIFPVNGRSVKSQLSSVPAVQRATKKAIVESLLTFHDTGTLPETGEVGGTVTIEVSILDNIASLTIDTSGDGLHKRGYRPMVGEAALKETMAAGLVLLSAWRPWRPLVDPFCGTGTIAIEAAMIGRNIAPGMSRSFDGEAWPALPPEIWETAREQAHAAALPPGSLSYAIHASDIDDRALDIARKAAKRAGGETGGPEGVLRDIHFHKRDFASLASKIEYGCIVTNPPYGVRLGAEEYLEPLYRSMPLILRGLPTWSFHILTARTDLEYLIGQNATRRRKLYNSQIECTYFTFLGPRPPRSLREAFEYRLGIAPSENDETPAGDSLNFTNVSSAPADPTVSTPALHTPAPIAEPVGSVVERAQSNISDSHNVILTSSSPLDPTIVTPSGVTIEQDDQDQPATRSEHNISSPSPQRTTPAGPAFGGLRDRDLRELTDFRSCLEKNVRHLRKYPARAITCYRIYDRDQVDVPLIIDIYEGSVHVAEYEREHSRTYAQQADWWDAVRAIVSEITTLPPQNIYTKEKHRQRGLSQHEKVDERQARAIVHEDGLKFEVNLSDYIDTGLFLDHRLTRGMVRDQSAGKRFLNLFCYTASFSVYAASGRAGQGAASTTSVDLSNTYLEWAERNFSVNGITGVTRDGQPGTHRLIRSDVLDFLDRHPRGEYYDLAVIDPPTFSNSKSTEEDWEVAIGHSRVLELVSGLLAPGGVIYFSTNYRRFKLDEATLARLNLRWQDISSRTVPPEYRNKRIHSCWRITKT
jgi:23S rRNA (guanine2445-N2)-methyltransferase / 23S rRNA (guanine2069-N7)-methyltransferase